MDTICPTGVLKLGFVDVYFPFLYFDGKQRRGLSLELWKIVAEQFNCASVQLTEMSHYTPETAMSGTGWELTDSGNLAFIKRSEVFTDLTLNSLSRRRFEEFRFTIDIAMDTLSLYQAVSSTSEESWTPYQFFLVFSPAILVLIIVFSILINLISMAHKRLKSSLGLCFGYMASMFFSLAVTMLFFLHAAVFKGNMIIIATPSLLSWDEAMANLRSGSFRLIESVSNIEDYGALLGTNKPLPPGSTTDSVAELCKTPSSSVIALYETQLLFATDTGGVPENCQIYRIQPQGNSTVIVQNFLPTNYAYLLPYNTTHKVSKAMQLPLQFTMFQTKYRINQIILKLFSYEKIQEYWLAKELRHPSLAFTGIQPSAPSSSSPLALSLVSLAGIFVAFVVGLVICFIVLILEIITSHYPQCQRAHMYAAKFI